MIEKFKMESIFLYHEAILDQRKMLEVCILSAENQKGVNAVQQCSVENQNGAIAIDFVQR